MQLLYNDAQLFMPATLWLWQPSVYIWTELNFYCISPPLLLFFFFQMKLLCSKLTTHTDGFTVQQPVQVQESTVLD